MFTKTISVFRWVIQISLVVASGLFIYQKNWTVFSLTLLTIVLIYVTRFVFTRYKIRLPIEFEFVLVAFLYASFFLGEAHDYYEKYEWWDTMLHTISGIILGIMGFLYFYFFNKSQKMKATPLFIAMTSFFFAIALGTLWEIVEYSLDMFFGFEMQNNSLKDTMGDLILDTCGALLASIWGFLYLRFGKFRFDYFIKKIIDNNPNLLG